MKYSVSVLFSNGKVFDFETTSDMRKLKPFVVNGETCVMTDEEHIINLRHVEKIAMDEL